MQVYPSFQYRKIGFFVNWDYHSIVSPSIILNIHLRQGYRLSINKNGTQQRLFYHRTGLKQLRQIRAGKMLPPAAALDLKLRNWLTKALLHHRHLFFIFQSKDNHVYKFY
jgi:hypothetical protein